ncbi:uncharacterized protein JCM6883_003801 [Sporobolomyces salmoneus]|uniref:uncharacterized protein n=1 Tax=Sporobolomyces salmoneus TaxID=183962 RepID=UPI00316EB764
MLQQAPAVMEVKREEGVPGRHRASSDPLSRGGNFTNGSGGRLDQEPNPFEQSFSGPGPSRPTDGTVTAGGRRARSTSPSSFIPRVTPGGINGSAKLPPLSFMQTPGGSDLSNFGWGVDSLRTGPLSPALLNGPTGSYDAAATLGRTGLTPLVGGPSGSQQPGGGPNQPGGGGGGSSNAAGAVSFPPPSPATAALFAMMTNNTPGTADASALAGGGTRPHEGPNEGNQFEASFARANSDSKLPPPQQHLESHPMNDLRQSAIMNNNNASSSHPHLPPAILQQSQSHPGPTSQAFIPHGSHSYTGHPLPPNPPTFPHAAPHLSHLAPHPHAQPPPHLMNHSFAPQTQQAPASVPPPQGGPSNATNPLDLLSQASFHNDDAVVAAAALSGLATPGGGFNAAAVAALNAHQNGQPQPNVNHPPPGIMPGSTMGIPQIAQHQQHHQSQHGQGQNGGGMITVKGEDGAGPQPPRAKRAAASNTGTGNKRTKRGAAAANQTTSGQSEEPEEAMMSGGTKKSQPKRAASKRGAAAKKQKSEDYEDFDGDDGGGDSMMDGDDDDLNMMDDPAPAPAVNKGGRGRKKDTGETEEEKRKNFLERNRQAALKCRQRKKAWLQSLQTKVELLTTDNDTLQTTVNNLTEEVNSLRAILAAHSNCPVAVANGAPSLQSQHSHAPPPHHAGMSNQPQQAYAQSRY